MKTHTYDIPDAIPETQSFLYMPLILHSMDPRVIQVTFPDKFTDAFDASVKQFDDEKGKVGITDDLPFTDLEGLRKVITAKLKEKNLCKYSILEKSFDSSFHLKGPQQTDILYGDVRIEMFLGYLVGNVIDKYKNKGAKIEIKKITAGGAKSRRRRHRCHKSRRR